MFSGDEHIISFKNIRLFFSVQIKKDPLLISLSLIPTLAFTYNSTWGFSLFFLCFELGFRVE